MKILRGVILTVCFAVIAFGCWKICSIRSGYRQGEKTYTALEAYVSPPALQPMKTASAAADKPTGEGSPPAEQIEFPVVDFAALRAVNPNVVGWIFCEDTAVNYPVVQGPDNDYYLDHMFTGEPNGSGAIFLNSRNNRDFTDRNNIIFGHNMNNGAMFHALSGFKDQSFYELHPRFLLMTPEKNYVMDIFAGAVMAEWDDVWKIGFVDDGEMECWLADIAAQSKITTPIHPTPADTILTLSTCTYEYNGARFVVLGVLKEA